MASILDPKDYYLLPFDEWLERHHKDSESAKTIDEDRWIRTPRLKILAPEVIVLKKYGERPPRRVVFNKPNLARRDEYTCQYCGVALHGERKITVEHVMPRSRGGPTTWENCVAACNDCNSRKADKTPPEAGMKLAKKPIKPNWSPRLAIPRSGQMRASWKPFIEKELATT